MKINEVLTESRLGNAVETAQRMYDKYAGLNYTAYDRAVDHSQNYESNTPQYQYWIDVAREIDRLERADTAKKKKSNLEEARVRYEDIVLDYSIDGANVDVRAIVDGKQVGYVIFNRDGRTLFPDDLAVDAEYRGRGIAKKMYDWVKSLPQKFEIIRGDQTAMGKRFWDKNRGEHVDVWEEGVAEGVVRIRVNELSVNRNPTVHKWQLRSDKNFGLINEVPSVILKNVRVSIDQNAYDNDKIFAYLQGDKTDSVPLGLKPFPIVFQRNGTYPFIDKSTGDPIENVAYVEFTDQGKVIGYKQGVAEDTDKYGFHTSVSKGKFLPSKYGQDENNLYLHDLMNVSGDGSGPQLVTIDDKRIATEIAAMYGGYVERTGMGTYRVYQPKGMRKSVKQPELTGVAEDTVDEMALASYKTLGDFSKPGSFRGVDKRLVPHPKSEIKAAKFFEQTPYDFRLFFANKSGLGQYQEYGPMTPDQIVKVFGEEDAKTILDNHDDAITVVYVSNIGAEKVMMTPWIMAHRFGHAIQAGARRDKWSAWRETEKIFFSTVNRLLDEYYGKVGSVFDFRKADQPSYNLTPEYNALFNAIGTQKSSRTGQIRRPYEFMYELFAQYLGTGTITLNPLPTNLGYGRKVFGNPTKYLNIKPEFRDETERRQVSEMLARDMELMFNDVLGNSVGQVYIM